MYFLNRTVITEFIITGFINIHKLRVTLFTFLFIMYVAICIKNILIVSLVCIVKHLQKPMYFFLSNLSLCDVLISTNVVPGWLHMLWTERGNITSSVCILQYYIYGSLAATECLLLTVMSYDRYLAICKPLAYTSLMTSRLCHNLIIFFWAAGFMPPIPIAAYLSKMQFCHLNTIDHIFCDVVPLLELACSDVSIPKLLVYSLSSLFTFFPFLLILASYIFIIGAILKIKSSKGRQKAFSTCSSHLVVVSLYYGTLFIMYGVPSERQSLNINKMLSLLYIVVTPFLNPIIYSLKNQEIAKAVAKLIRLLLQNINAVWFIQRKHQVALNR